MPASECLVGIPLVVEGGVESLHTETDGPLVHPRQGGVEDDHLARHVRQQVLHVGGDHLEGLAHRVQLEEENEDTETSCHAESGKVRD